MVHNFFVDGLNALGFASSIYTVICYDVSTGLGAMGYSAVTIQVYILMKSFQR